MKNARHLALYACCALLVLCAACCASKPPKPEPKPAFNADDVKAHAGEAFGGMDQEHRN